MMLGIELTCNCFACTGRWLPVWGAGTSNLNFPAGVRLLVWLKVTPGDDGQKQFDGLTNALGGLFCASLNKIGVEDISETLSSFA